MAGLAKKLGLKFKQALETIKTKIGCSLANIKDDVGDLSAVQRRKLNVTEYLVWAIVHIYRA